MRPQHKGLSHGLKIARPLSIFAQPSAVPPFRVPSSPKIKGRHKPPFIFGAGVHNGLMLDETILFNAD